MKIILGLIISIFLSTHTWSAEPTRLSLLIHPFLKDDQIYKHFAPLATFLSHSLKIPVDIKISSGYNSHITSIGNNQFDIAYIGPYAYVKMVKIHGKKPLLGRLEIRGSPTFQGKIVTLIDSPIRALKDLKGKKFAFGDPSSTMSYIVPKYVLHTNGIQLTDLISYQHHRSHSAVIEAVLSTAADAGAVKEEMYYKNMDNLKAIASTPKISEHLFLAQPFLAPHLIQKLRHALLTMNQNKEGLIAMRSIKSLMTGVVSVKHEDYDNLSTIYSNSLE